MLQPAATSRWNPLSFKYLLNSFLNTVHFLATNDIRQMDCRGGRHRLMVSQQPDENATRYQQLAIPCKCERCLKCKSRLSTENYISFRTECVTPLYNREYFNHLNGRMFRVFYGADHGRVWIWVRICLHSDTYSRINKLWIENWHRRHTFRKWRAAFELLQNNPMLMSLMSAVTAVPEPEHVLILGMRVHITQKHTVIIIITSKYGRRLLSVRHAMLSYAMCSNTTLYKSL